MNKMKNLNLKEFGFEDLSNKEKKETNGGFITLLVAHALQAALVAGLGAGIVGSFEAGYNAVRKK